MMLKIGCFGSVITFSPNTESCTRCELRDACAKTVFEREPKVMAILVKRETERGTKPIEEVDSAAIATAAKHFLKRRKIYLGVTVTKTGRYQKDFAIMKANGVAFARMKAGQNPIAADYGSYDYMRLGIDFVLREKVFTAKDIQEHFLTSGFYDNTSTARSYSNRIVSILLQSEQIKKEGKVYCLQT